MSRRIADIECALRELAALPAVADATHIPAADAPSANDEIELTLQPTHEVVPRAVIGAVCDLPVTVDTARDVGCPTHKQLILR